MSLLIKRIDSRACLPVKGSEEAAGHDLFSCEEVVIPARGRALVSTGISIGLPAGTYGRIAPRSGLAWKHGIDVGAGVIDPDYRGVVRVVLFNNSNLDFQVKFHDRIAQLILEQFSNVPVQEVTELNVTLRDSLGFGSSGV